MGSSALLHASAALQSALWALAWEILAIESLLPPLLDFKGCLLTPDHRIFAWYYNKLGRTRSAN